MRMRFPTFVYILLLLFFLVSLPIFAMGCAAKRKAGIPNDVTVSYTHIHTFYNNKTRSDDKAMLRSHRLTKLMKRQENAEAVKVVS